MSIAAKCTCWKSISGFCNGQGECPMTTDAIIKAINKPIHAKPSLYAFYFEKLKDIAKDFGYNLVLHGSMARDLDLIAIPWMEIVRPHGEMIESFVSCIGGHIMPQNGNAFETTHHGRMWYVININRGGKETDYEDPQYYIDISVMPTK